MGASRRHELGEQVTHEEMPPCSVTELKGMFGPAVRTVSIAEMNRAIAARSIDVAAETEDPPPDRGGDADDRE